MISVFFSQESNTVSDLLLLLNVKNMLYPASTNIFSYLAAL